MKYLTLSLILFVGILGCTQGTSLEKPKEQTHLFILSGQSNMAGLNPKISFIPAVEKEYGKDKTIVVKSAQGGQPIRRWFKEYKFPEGVKIKDKFKAGDLYDKLMGVVNEAVKGKTFDTVTFVLDARRKRC